MLNTRHEGSIPFTRSPLQEQKVGNELENVQAFSTPASPESAASIAGDKVSEEADQLWATEQFVYFIRCVGAGFIKIGCCDRDHGPLKRLAALQCASPFELELLGVVKGTPGLEHKLHRRFAHLRGRGEWFAEAPELLRYVRQSTPVKTRGVVATCRRGQQKSVIFEGAWKLAWSGRHYHFCEPGEERALCSMLCDRGDEHASVNRCLGCERKLAKQIEKIRARFVKVGLTTEVRQ